MYIRGSVGKYYSHLNRHALYFGLISAMAKKSRSGDDPNNEIREFSLVPLPSNHRRPDIEPQNNNLLNFGSLRHELSQAPIVVRYGTPVDTTSIPSPTLVAE